MLYLIVLFILLFNYAVFKISSKCSRWEESYIIKEENEKQD